MPEESETSSKSAGRRCCDKEIGVRGQPFGPQLTGIPSLQLPPFPDRRSRNIELSDSWLRTGQIAVGRSR